jgi:hypothetical protein
MTKLSLLLVGVVSLLAVPVYGADAVDSGNCPDPGPSEETAASPAALKFDPLFLAAGGRKGRLGGLLIKDQNGGITTTCEWYTIDCIEEEDDRCCGSLSSCLAYCEEVCKGPCEQAN